MKHCGAWLLAACFVAVGSGRADTLTIGIRNIQGTFEGFSDDAFVFRSDKGETLRENRTNVRSLQLDAPVKVAYEMARGGKGSQSALLKSYKGMRFVFKDGDKERTVFANHVKEIRVVRPPPAGGGGREPDGSAFIQPVDISKVENNPDLTAGQKAAIERYRTARARYDNFFRESSELVARMDRAEGAERIRIHQELRVRKQEEQPIINALQAATTQLYNAFPPRDDDPPPTP